MDGRSFPGPDEYVAETLSDITSGKHGGAETSRQAFERIRPYLTRSQQRVLDVVKRRGPVGATCREIADELRCGMNAVSGRLTELRVRKKIVVSLREPRRGGGQVWVVPAWGGCTFDRSSGSHGHGGGEILGVEA